MAKKIPKKSYIIKDTLVLKRVKNLLLENIIERYSNILFIDFVIELLIFID